MMIKKIITLLLILFLTACSSGTVNEEEVVKDDAYYLAKIENYVSRDKNKNNTKDNEEFKKILEDAFADYIENDYINLRDYLSDYNSYNLSKPTAKWESLQYNDLSKVEYYENELVKLSKIDYDSLSYTQQFDYEKYEYHLYDSILKTMYEKYDKPFSVYGDFIRHFVTNLTEFRFDSKEYVDDYFLLLKDGPRYIDEALEYTAKQAQDGIYLDNESIDYSYEYAIQMMGSEDHNDLIDSFNSAIEEVDFLSDEEKETYKQENEKLIKELIVPEFEKIANQLVEYYDKVSGTDLEICKLSQNYAKYIVYTNSSSNKNIDELFDNIVNEFLDMSNKYLQARNDEQALAEYAKIYDSELTYDEFKLDDKETLKHLETLVLQIVPDIGELSYEISPIKSASENSTINAYFLQPRLDDINHSIMRTNPYRNTSDLVKNFYLMSHEGLPGHMYQFQYYVRTNPELMNFVYLFMGYYEGWAVYSGMEAFELNNIENESTRDICRFSLLMSYYLCAIGDLYYNYYGHTIEEFASFLDEKGYNASYAESIFEIVTSDYGSDYQYAIGHNQFINLKRKAMEALGDKFDEVSFNEELLVHGPLPIVVLEKAIDDYILENK